MNMLSSEKSLPAEGLDTRPTSLVDPALMMAALEGSSDGVMLIDGKLGGQSVLYVNAAFARFTGYSPAEAHGRNAEFVFDADGQRESIAKLRAAVRAGEEFADEMLCRHKDGRTFWALASLRPITAGTTQRYWVGTIVDVTKQHRLRESLQTSEARLELAMAASELAMWDWNIVSGEVFYNAQWQALLCTPPEELLLRESLAERLVLPPENASVLNELEKHLAGETPKFEQEFEIRTLAGQSKWVSARAQVVRRDREGRALRAIGVWRDVTARRENSRTLDEANKRWERAVAGTSEGLFEWDLATGYVWYAPRFRELLECGEHDFPNNFTAFQKALHAEDRMSVLARIRSQLEQRVPLDLSCRLACGSGDYRWFRLRALAERDAAGRPKRLSGSIRDISSQIDAEQALHRSEDFYRTVLDALPVSVGYIDRNEHIVYANHASQLLLGEKSAVLQSACALRDVVQPGLYAQLASHLNLAFANQIVECQLQTLDAAGHQLDIDVSYLPHRNERGDVQGCFLLARNVTARLQLEAELRQSQKMEAIGRLTGGVAHDFNNLLSVVIGNAQLLTRTLRDSPRLFKQADTVLRAAMRGAELTRRLLTFARQQSATAQVVQVNDLLGGIFDLVKRTLPSDIELKLDADVSVGTTKFDPGQFENAILNLVINARDAMPQGGVISIATRAITISAHHRGDEPEHLAIGDYTMVSVRDNGSGMTPETLKRAFEPFFTTKESGKGSGLGLAMVYGFVKGANGHVQIDSATGDGTTIRMYFPRTGELKMEEAAHTATSELPHGTETILVVDDNADVRSTAVEMLQSLGYRVLSAGGGRDALQLATPEARVQLLFSDLMLPGGVSTSALIKKLRAQHSQIRVLLTSGFSDSVIANRAMLDGSIEIIAKPYQLNDLARRVRAVLDHVEEPNRVQPR